MNFTIKKQTRNQTTTIDTKIRATHSTRWSNNQYPVSPSNNELNVRKNDLKLFTLHLETNGINFAQELVINRLNNSGALNSLLTRSM